MNATPVTPEGVSAYDATAILDEMTHSKSAERREREVNSTLDLIGRLRSLDARSRIFEIGAGMGWFTVFCLRRGIPCEGVELTPIFVEAAQKLAAQYSVPSTVQRADIDNVNLGESRFDAIVAESVLEHTHNWQSVIRQAYRALKPGGVFYMVSSNKFCPIAGDYPRLPFYGWLPDRARYWLRQKLDGPEILQWGVDSNQFRYWQLRKFFKSVGFSQVLDYVQVKQAGPLNHPSALRRFILRLTRFAPARHAMLTFWPSTFFMCVK